MHGTQIGDEPLVRHPVRACHDELQYLDEDLEVGECHQVEGLPDRRCRRPGDPSSSWSPRRAAYSRAPRGDCPSRHATGSCGFSSAGRQHLWSRGSCVGDGPEQVRGQSISRLLWGGCVREVLECGHTPHGCEMQVGVETSAPLVHGSCVVTELLPLGGGAGAVP